MSSMTVKEIIDHASRSINPIYRYSIIDIKINSSDIHR